MPKLVYASRQRKGLKIVHDGVAVNGGILNCATGREDFHALRVCLLKISKARSRAAKL